MTAPTGTWTVIVDPESDVRLRSERVGPFSLTVTAPVRAGRLAIDSESTHVYLELELNRLSTSNFLLQRAARKIIDKYNGQVLRYDATGDGGADPWHVTGVARSGTVEVEMTLVVTPAGPENEPMGVIELGGSAVIPDVDLGIPGVGKIDELSFDVDARLGLIRT